MDSRPRSRSEFLAASGRHGDYLKLRRHYLKEGLPKPAATVRALRELGFEGNDLSFDEALAGLPDTCGPARELDWVRAHPAMGRLARSKDKTVDIEISVDDVLDPLHGAAPSKGAVAMLQYWSNRPQKFWEMLLSEHKKQISTEDPRGKLDPEEDLEKVERILKQCVTSRVHRNETNEMEVEEDGS